jgi:hypothetical protein
MVNSHRRGFETWCLGTPAKCTFTQPRISLSLLAQRPRLQRYSSNKGAKPLPKSAASHNTGATQPTNTPLHTYARLKQYDPPPPSSYHGRKHAGIPPTWLGWTKRPPPPTPSFASRAPPPHRLPHPPSLGSPHCGVAP